MQYIARQQQLDLSKVCCVDMTVQFNVYVVLIWAVNISSITVPSRVLYYLQIFMTFKPVTVNKFQRTCASGGLFSVLIFVFCIRGSRELSNG